MAATLAEPSAELSQAQVTREELKARLDSVLEVLFRQAERAAVSGVTVESRSNAKKEGP